MACNEEGSTKTSFYISTHAVCLTHRNIQKHGYVLPFNVGYTGNLFGLNDPNTNATCYGEWRNETNNYYLPII